MANPTSNFNWQMPTPTDLVTDLPADFEVFGQAVDSSMADLLGGTTGQILAKNSNTNMDFVWITNDVGDITAVTAGTGISGGGTSGAVTITNSMATEITAKGDLIVGTGNAAFDNLPAGTNGHVLTADSTVSPTGLKWAALPSSTPTFVGCDVHTATDQSTSNSTHTTINFELEYIDSDSFHSNVTNNSRITIPSGKAGKYRIFGQISYLGDGTGGRRISIAKNGSRQRQTITAGSANAYTFVTAEAILDLIVGDYIELQAFQNSGGSLSVVGTEGYTHFSAEYLGA